MFKAIVKTIRNIKDPGSTGEKRSSEWSKVRDAFLKENPECAVCGEKDLKVLEVHHIQPFHTCPEKELDKTNFIVLCRGDRNDHFYIGHVCSFKTENKNIVEDAKYIRSMIERVKKEQ